MWLRSSLLILALLAFAYGQLKIEGIEPPPVDVREKERQNVERRTGGRAPELTSPSIPSPPPPPEGPPLPPPPQPTINLKDLRRKTFDIRYGQNLREKEKEKAQATSEQGQMQSFSQAEKEQRFNLKGFCRVLDDVEVVLEPQQARVECLLSRKLYRGYMLFTPEMEKFSLKAELVELEGKKLSKSEVWTADRRSKNVAMEVDRRLIANILLNAGRTTGREVAEVAKQAIRPDQRITLPGGSSLIVVEQDSKQTLRTLPEYALYAALANLVGATAEEVLAGQRRLPPLFKVKKGQEFYVEAEYCEGCR